MGEDEKLERIRQMKLKQLMKKAEETAGGMKVCIPTMGNLGLDEQVGEHFGRVPTYTIVDLDRGKVKVVPNTSRHVGGQGYPPEIMTREGVNVMLCRGLGRRAIGMFEEFGIMVYVGAYGTVRDAIQMWKNDRLQMATDENACREHAFRRKEHGYGYNYH